MAAAILPDARTQLGRDVELDSPSRLVPAAEFRKLLVSHRRMVRVDRRAERLKGLQDLDTGEVFLTDERWLLDRIRG